MKDLLIAVKIKNNDGTYSDSIPFGVSANNVNWDTNHNLIDILGTIDLSKGDIQTQLSSMESMFDLDVTPTTGSSKPVTSAGIKAALDSVNTEIGELKENITNLSEGVGDLKSAFEHTLVDTTIQKENWESGSLTAADGSALASTTRIRTRDYIDPSVIFIKPVSGYKISLYAWNISDGLYVGIWNGNAFVKSVASSNWTTEGWELSDFNGLYIFRVLLAKTDDTSILIDDYDGMIVKCTTDVSLSMRGKSADAKVVGDFITEVEKITEKHASVNRFDIDDPLTKHYKLWQNGTLANSGSSHYFVTCPIAVTEGDVVRRNATDTSIQFGAYVNTDGVPGDAPRTISTKQNIWTATRSGYISINFSARSLQNAMVTINEDMPEEFVPYYNYVSFGDGIHLGDTQIEDVRSYGSPISGKLIAYNGDSICESRINQETADNGGAYAKIIADIMHGTYANRAISGGILASAPGDGGSTPNRCVVSDVANMTDDADLICFEGGINDYWRDVPLGDYSESDYSGTLDTTTVCGALESIFRQATTKWVGKPIVFVIVHKIKSTVYAVNSAGYTFAQEREKMIGICNKYAIPYYDAFTESGLNAYNDIQNTNFLTSNSTGNPDGCHPNEAAYRRYYVPQLIALFESVMPRLAE